MKHLKLLMLLLLMTVTVAFSQYPEGLEKLDFFIGEWELTTCNLQQDGTVATGKATSSAYHILDGQAIQDDFRGYDEHGNIVFRGTSIQSYSSDQPQYLITWIMAGRKGLTDIRAEWKGGKLVGKGEGYDGFGSFKERFEYYNISDSSYTFQMDRSYDGGETWLKNFNIEAYKIKQPEN